MPKLPRGMQLNNPCNIKISHSVWLGKVSPSLDESLETFETISYGMRAACVLFRNYRTIYNLQTVREYIGRWAPIGVDHNPASYPSFVAEWCGVGMDDNYDITQPDLMITMLQAVTHFEQGYDAVDKDTIKAVVYPVLNRSGVKVA